MVRILVRVVVIAELLFGIVASGLLLQCPAIVTQQRPSSNTRTCSGLNAEEEGKTTRANKAMDFLRKVGRIGNNQDFTNAIGVDEGPSGKAKGVRVCVFVCVCFVWSMISSELRP
jgi:hypothetical protein